MIEWIQRAGQEIKERSLPEYQDTSPFNASTLELFCLNQPHKRLTENSVELHSGELDSPPQERTFLACPGGMEPGSCSRPYKKWTNAGGISFCLLRELHIQGTMPCTQGEAHFNVPKEEQKAVEEKKHYISIEG